MSASSDRIRRIRALAEFKEKASAARPTIMSQSSEFATGSAYGAIVSRENGCCEPAPTNYAAYFTVTDSGRNGGSPFSIPANSEFTIEWWQTDVSANEFQSRHILSFGTQSELTAEFACLLDQGSVIIRIGNLNYPLYDSDTNTQPDIYYGLWNTMVDTQNHFAIMRVNDSGTYKIRVFKNGGFLGEFQYADAITITNTVDTQLTIRNQSAACAESQMYGSLPSFRWTSARLYPLTTYYEDASNFAPPAMPLAPQANDVLTINNFPISGSNTTFEGYTVTHFNATGLLSCIPP
jgi:hypothetical protein